MVGLIVFLAVALIILVIVFTTHNVIDLGTKVHKTIDLGVVNKGVITTTGTGESGLILGQNVDSNGFKMDSNTIQINEGNP